MEIKMILPVLLLVLPYLTATSDLDQEPPRNRSTETLLRRRRYVSFPEGASFSMAACLTVGVLGNPQPGIFTWGLNWGISFELPNETISEDAFKKTHKLPRPVIARRFRRDLYKKLELVITDMGYNGRDCIFRALCEAAQRLLPKGNSVIEELFRTVFTLPLTRVLPNEPMEHHLYDKAHKSGMTSESCYLKYRNCPVSLLDLASGYYSPKLQHNLQQSTINW